jgi:hypothetical protein
LFDFLGGELVLVGGIGGDAKEGKEDKGKFLEDIVKYAIGFHGFLEAMITLGLGFAVAQPNLQLIA